jgi:hypothetical protein
MICAKCGRERVGGKYSFWCYKKDELPAVEGTVPIHSFSGFVCDSCVNKRRASVVILFSIAMMLIGFFIPMAIFNHNPLPWALLLSAAMLFISLVAGYFQAKKEFIGSRLAFDSRKRQLLEDGFEGFYPTKPQAIVRYRS